jgi:vacuolar-type H+-ATPase subunit I/STV1
LVNTSDLHLPTQLINELSEAKSATNAMFVLFILGDVLLFLGICLGIITAVSTLRPTLMFFLSLLTVFVVLIATILATVVYRSEATKIRNAYADDGLTVNLSLGSKAVALVWLGTVFAAAAAVGWTCVYIFWRRGRPENRQSEPWWRFHRSVNEPVISGPIIPRRQKSIN